MRSGLAILLVLVAIPPAARADDRTVVLAVTADADVPASMTGTVTTALIAAATMLDLRSVTDSEAKTSARAGCAADAACVVELGRKLAARRVVACTLQRADGYRLYCQLIDVATAEMLGDGQRTFTADRAADDSADVLMTLVATAPPLEDPAPAPAPAPPAAGAPPAPAVSAAAHSPDPTLRWRIVASGGVAVARSDLPPGAHVAIGAARAVDRQARILAQVRIDLTWFATQDDVLVAPTSFPRGRAELIQESMLVGLWAGADHELVAAGPARLYGGLDVGLMVHRARFEAFSMAQSKSAVAPALTVRAGARSPPARIAWGVELAWREVAHDLGDAGDFGEATTSGLVVSVGAGVAF